MRPYALAHRVWLAGFNSPFVVGGFPIFDDLLLGTIVCAQTWEENQKFFASRWRQWSTMKIWGLFNRRFDIPRSIVALKTYLDRSDVFPETEKGEGKTRELGTANSARLYAFLRSSGFSESEAWNMPLSVANILHAARLEEDGKLELVSGSRKALLDRLQKRQREGGLAA